MFYIPYILYILKYKWTWWTSIFWNAIFQNIENIRNIEHIKISKYKKYKI